MPIPSPTIMMDPPTQATTSTSIEANGPKPDMQEGPSSRPTLGEPYPAAFVLRDGCEAPTSTQTPRAGDRLLHLHPSECRVSPFNGREQASLDETSLAPLIAAISAAGSIIEPIVVRPTGDLVCPWEVIAGTRRRAAASILLTTMPNLTIPAIVRDGDVRMQMLIADGENRGRADLSAFERGSAFVKALKAGVAKNGVALAELLKVSEPVVSDLTRLTQWPDDLLAAYGSRHNILAVDAERVNRLMKQHKLALVKEARSIQAELKSGGSLHRAAVTRRLVKVAGQARASTPVIARDADGAELLRIIRRNRSGMSVFLSAYALRNHEAMKQALGVLQNFVIQHPPVEVHSR